MTHAVRSSWIYVAVGLLGAAGLAAYFRRYQGGRPVPEFGAATDSKWNANAGREASDIVEEASIESFPASDAPAW